MTPAQQHGSGWQLSPSWGKGHLTGHGHLPSQQKLWKLPPHTRQPVGGKGRWRDTPQTLTVAIGARRPLSVRQARAPTVHTASPFPRSSFTPTAPHKPGSLGPGRWVHSMGGAVIETSGCGDRGKHQPGTQTRTDPSPGRCRSVPGAALPGTHVWDTSTSGRGRGTAARGRAGDCLPRGAPSRGSDPGTPPHSGLSSGSRFSLGPSRSEGGPGPGPGHSPRRAG